MKRSKVVKRVPTNFYQDLKQGAKRALKMLKYALMLSVIVLAWVVSIDVAKTGLAPLSKLKVPDLATILFGAGSVALFIFSILVGIVAIVGWQAVEGKINEAVETATNERLAILENEMRGRGFAILGYVIGENSVLPDFSAPSNEERLTEAIFFCEQGYDRLKNTGVPTEFMALNNLLTYSCVLRDKSRRGYLLDGARRLRAAAEDHDSPNLLLTYAKTILEFSQEQEEVKEACSVLADVQSNPRLNEKQKREAEHLASLCKLRVPGWPG
jgi:hypothetical protein